VRRSAAIGTHESVALSLRTDRQTGLAGGM